MLNKDTHKKTAKIVGEMGDPSKIFHLQHSSLDTMHTWITYSAHKSAEDAEKMLRSVISKLPTHFKWRIVKLD
jgi:hypothetical protein